MIKHLFTIDASAITKKTEKKQKEVSYKMFLPEDYKSPSSTDDYMKIVDGDNRFRILSKPIIGWEEWVEDEKGSRPIRYKMNEKPATPIDPKKPIRHFWAFIVYNVLEKKIQILNLCQNSIRKQIEEIINNTDWGSPYEYDIVIKRTGTKVETKYNVMPTPHRPVSEEVKDMFHLKPGCLDLLFINGHPFEQADPRTKAFWENEVSIEDHDAD